MNWHMFKYTALLAFWFVLVCALFLGGVRGGIMRDCTRNLENCETLLDRN